MAKSPACFESTTVFSVSWEPQPGFFNDSHGLSLVEKLVQLFWKKKFFIDLRVAKSQKRQCQLGATAWLFQWGLFDSHGLSLVEKLHKIFFFN